MRSKRFMSRWIVGILIAAMSITSVPISVYAEKSADVESVAEETSSDTETKMSEETAWEKRFEEAKTDTQEIGEEGSTDESVTDIVEPELSTDEIQDSKEEPATEILEKDETQTDVEETLEYEETWTDTEESETEPEIEEEIPEKEFDVRAASDITRDDAVAWVKSQNGEWLDYDKFYGAQCVDLICYYYQYLGATVLYGNASAYAYNALPAGWSRISFNANVKDVQPGDIAVWTGTATGHVAIVVSADANGFNVAEQNYAVGADGTYDYGDVPCAIRYHEGYRHYYGGSLLNCVIRPNFKSIDRVKGTYMSTGYYQTIPDGDYHIVSSFGDQWWLTNSGFSIDDGGNVQLWDYSGMGMECDDHVYRFQFIDGGDGRGFYKITNKLSGKCLDVDGASEYMKDENGNPTNVQQWTDNGSPAQQWAVREVNGGDKGVMYTFQARCSGFCLDLSGGESNVKSGANISMWEDNGTPAQQWRLIPWAPSIGKTINDGEYQIAPFLAEDKVVSASEMDPGSGANVELNSYREDYRHTFDVKYLGNGYYSIINKYSGASLDVADFSRRRGANIQLCTYSGNDAQKWIIKSCGDGYYEIISKCSGLYLDLANAETKDGTNIWTTVWMGKNNTAQKWRFIPYTNPVAVEKLTLNKTTLTLQTGEIATLTAAISPDNATNKTLTWQSSDTSVVDVDNNGTVIAKSEGTAVITVASANGKTASCKVTVTNNDPYGDILKEDLPEDGKIPEGLWLAGIANGYTYTGKAIKPEVRVYDHKTRLKEKKDYTLSYKNNTNAGDANSLKPPTITVTGKGNYKGKETQTFTISPKNLADKDITADDIVLKENGKVQKPVPTITWNNKKLAKKKDYTISYPNEAADGAYMKTGTYSIRVKGAGNYTGERTITLTITQDAVKPSKKISLSKTNAELQFDKIASYTGNAVKPDRYTLTFTTKDASGNNNTVTLKEGSDYKVSYQNNVKAGKASILFQGINNYSGTLRKTYNIAPYDIETDTDKKIEITLSDAYAYTKGGCKPKPIVMFGKTALTEGTDYTLSYQNNTNLSNEGNIENTPTVIIKGKGNFKGTCKETFAIRPKDIGTLTLTAADKTWQNKSNLYKTKIVIKDEDGKTLSSGKDYNSTILYEYNSAVTLADGTTRNAGETVSPQDIIPADTTIRVTVKADGENYTGTLTGTYRIVKADIGKASVKIPLQIYTGKPIEPDKSQITVKLKGQTLSEKDYDISCSNNINKGTATMIIKGKNDCGGTKTVKFKIKEKGFLWWWR